MKVRRWLWRAFLATGALVVLAVGLAAVSGWTAFGHRAVGPRKQRAQASPQWRDGQFRNPQPLQMTSEPPRCPSPP